MSLTYSLEPTARILSMQAKVLNPNSQSFKAEKTETLLQPLLGVYYEGTKECMETASFLGLYCGFCVCGSISLFSTASEPKPYTEVPFLLTLGQAGLGGITVSLEAREIEQKRQSPCLSSWMIL